MPRMLCGLLGTILLAGASFADGLPTASQRFAGDSQETPSFQRHVLPLLGRLGCNGRACHGSFQGRGGFRLSLFGYDFTADHTALTSGDTPRVDLDDPKESLILKKPTLALAHKGGKRMEPGGWQFKLLLRWIQTGAVNDASEKSRLERLSVSPAEYVFKRPGEQFQLRVVAHWSSGTVEDVTELARFRSNDEAISTISDQGLVTAVGKGDTHVVVFYDNGIKPVQTILPVSEQTGSRYPRVAAPTRVDELVLAKLRLLGIIPSDLCTDAEFLRRVSLDLTGTLPTAAEIESFLAEDSPDKRNRKIDELLSRPAYATWWTTKLCDLTGNNSRYRDAAFGQDYARQWYEWIYARVQANVSYDKLVAGLVLSSGRQPGQSLADYSKEMSSYFRKDQPADFATRETMPHYWSRTNFQNADAKALGFSYSFLGVRLQCAECHKHPFDQWTKQDFEQFKAFFSRIVYGVPPQDRDAYSKMMAELTAKSPELKGNKAVASSYNLVREGKVIPWQEIYVAQPGDTGTMKGKAPPPRKGAAIRAVTARLLGDDKVKLESDVNPRDLLVKWLLRPDNPYFARAFVNRVWAGYFSAGIIEPPDDLSLANPPSNAALLDYLTKGFVEHGYDMKWLHREIATSRTYQLSWKPNDTNRLDGRNFSHAVPRRLPAEVAYDAVAAATTRDEDLAAWQTDRKQRAIAAGSNFNPKNKGQSNYLLTVFGKPTRINNCDCDRSNDASLLQTLFMLNDGEIQSLIDRRDGWLVAPLTPDYTPRKQAKGTRKQAGDQGFGPAEEQEFVREAYLRTVSRPPTDREVARCLEYLRKADSLASGMRDVLWALLNTNEFIVNH